MLVLETYRLDADPTMWAVTCFFLRPSARGAGLVTLMLRGVMADLDGRGVTAVQGYPRRGDFPAEDVWTGTEGTFVSAGFRCVRDDQRRPVFQRG